MKSTPRPDQTALISTGVVARILGLKQNAIRGMIEQETLPQPQWMSLGRRVERVYTQEWLLLALDAMRERHIFSSELRSPFVPRGYRQFAIRFDSSDWTLKEIIDTLAATNRLWLLCNQAVGLEAEEVPPLRVRRLSAGSPMDILVTIESVAKAMGGPAAAAALIIWVLKNPGKVTGALPSALAEWREQWARFTRAGTDQRRAKLERAQFEAETKVALEEMKSTPAATGLAVNDPAPLAIDPEPHRRPRDRFLVAPPRSIDPLVPRAIESDDDER